MEYGLIGCPLGHSYSVEVHGCIGDYPYELKELASTEVASFLQKRDFRAVNVTIPYKETVIPYLDEISEEARAIGSVNTVVNRDGKLYGYNTDLFGFLYMLKKGGISLAGKKVLILGTGGTAKTALAAAKQEGAREICLVSRNPKRGQFTYAEAVRYHADADILINATPVGMYPHVEETPVDIGRFPALSGVADVIYHPLRTRLLQEAEARGIPSVGGLSMLAAQGVRAWAHFFDCAPEDGMYKRVYEGVLSRMENRVLIGMPGCGKTLIGRALAQRDHRYFTDTDAEIQKQSGKTPAELITERGEEAFRDIETEIIKKAALRSGTVIATGGGAVLREENMKALAQNGRIIFIDRPLSLLTPSEDRPLSQTAEALRKRYEERIGLYRRYAGRTVENKTTAQEALFQIDMDKAVFFPSVLSGDVTAPPSKSAAQRMLLAAALAKGETVLQGCGESGDIAAALDCIRALGAEVRTDGDKIFITGGRTTPEKAIFPCRESGTVLRLFLPVALALGIEAHFTGSERLFERGVGVYEELFGAKGVCFFREKNGLTARGRLTPGIYSLPGDVSSQYVSGLLFALPLLPGTSVIDLTSPLVSTPYAELTKNVLKQFGIRSRKTGDGRITVFGRQKYLPTQEKIPGDWSNGAVYYCLNALGHDIGIFGLKRNSAQGDRVIGALAEKLKEGYAEIDVADCPDLAPLLMATAGALHGCRLLHTGRLSLKESDRGRAMGQELAKLGIRVQVQEDEITVTPGLQPPAEELCGHNDHRICMALSALLLRTGGVLTGAAAVSKSYPGFYADLRSVGAKVTFQDGEKMVY